MRVEHCRELGIILAIAFRVGTNQAWRPFRSKLLVYWLAIPVDHDICLAQIRAVFSPILRLVDAGKFLTWERSVVPFAILTLADVVGGIADASPQFNLASIGIGLLRSEETTEAGTRVDELGEVGWGSAFAVDDAGIIGVRHSDDNAGFDVQGVAAKLERSLRAMYAR